MFTDIYNTLLLILDEIQLKIAPRGSWSCIDETNKSTDRFITQCVDFSEQIEFEKHVSLKLEHCAFDADNIIVFRSDGCNYDEFQQIKQADDIDNEEDDYFSVDKQHITIFTKTPISFCCIEKHNSFLMPSSITLFMATKFVDNSLMVGFYVYNSCTMIKQHLQVRKDNTQQNYTSHFKNTLLFSRLPHDINIASYPQENPNS